MKIASKSAPLRLVPDRPDTSNLKRIAGSNRDTFNTDLITATLKCLSTSASLSEDRRTQQYEAAAVALMAFQPTDEIEGMLAAQAVAMHHMSMECARRAIIPEQPFEMAQGFRKAAANASRTFIELLAALDKKRGKGGQQKVTVEHVHVHSGGQAIVGAVAPGAPGGGATEKAAAEPCVSAAGLAHDTSLGAVISPLRGAGPEHAFLRTASDAERPLPVAWRKIDGSEDGCGD